MVRPERFELPTPWFEAKCSIQMSYGRTKNGILIILNLRILCLIVFGMAAQMVRPERFELPTLTFVV
jgi:hypothetical protein